MAAPLVIALVGFGGWLVSKAFSQDESDLEEEEVDRSLPNAKGRLTKAINKLAKKLEALELARAEISLNKGLVEAIDCVNALIERARIAVKHESAYLEHMAAASVTLDHVGVGLTRGFDSFTAHEAAGLRGQITKQSRALILKMPKKAAEPKISDLKAGLSSGLETVYDYEKARKKVNKLIRCIEAHIAIITETLPSLLVAVREPAGGSSSRHQLEVALMSVLVLYSKPILSKKGNITKAYK